MEDPKKELVEIDEKIKTLREKKKKIKKIQKNGSRLKSNNTGKSNILRRVSINFQKRLDLINKRREENGFDELSEPKITELIIKHKTAWKIIEGDIIRYNTNLERNIMEMDFNER